MVFYSTFFITNAGIASERSPSSGFGAFMPLIIMFAIFYWSLIKPLTKRKGKSRWLELLVLMPGVNLIYIIWLASLTDKAILEKVDALENILKKLDSVSKELQIWKCNCGITNDINVLNCPECGLKRDYLKKG